MFKIARLPKSTLAFASLAFSSRLRLALPTAPQLSRTPVAGTDMPEAAREHWWRREW